MPEDPAPDVIYNGACPVCDAGIQAFRNDHASVDYTDITIKPAILGVHGLTAEDVQYRVHAVTADGNLVRGIDAVSVMLVQKPGWRLVGRALGWPVIRQVGWVGYEIAAFVLFRWNKKRGNF